MAAALREFASHSFQAASLNDIIRASGLSKGVVYYYFASKEDLFLTLLQGCIGDLAGEVAGKMGGGVRQRENYWTHVAHWLMRLGEALVTDPSKALFLQGVIEALSRGEIPFARESLRNASEWLNDRLVEGQILGAVRRDLPLELLVHMVWGIVRTILAWFDSDVGEGRTYDVPRCVLAMVDTLQRLCAPRDAIGLSRRSAASTDRDLRSGGTADMTASS